jgi:hypothetical protein
MRCPHHHQQFQFHRIMLSYLHLQGQLSPLLISRLWGEIRCLLEGGHLQRPRHRHHLQPSPQRWYIPLCWLRHPCWGRGGDKNPSW